MKRKRTELIYKSFDTETSGLSIWCGARIFAYCIGDEDGNVRNFLHSSDAPYERSRLQRFFDNTRISKVCHNYKFELTFLLNEGFTIPEDTVWHDTKLMSQLLRNLAPGHGLDELAWELCGYPLSQDKEIERWRKTTRGRYDKIPQEVMDPYQTADGQRTMLLFKIFYPELCKDQALYKDYINEIALVKTTIRLEEYGIKVDADSSRDLLQWLQKEHEKTVQEVWKEYGEYINLGSDKQLGSLLYDRLGYPVISHTKSGAPSTDKDTLMELQKQYLEDRVFKLAIKWRSYTTGQAMVRSYLELMEEDTHILHPTINTNKARTGRESSENPNLHNVSKTEALKNLFPVPARKCFCARKHHWLLFADYAGIEMRLIIDRSNCLPLIQLIKDRGDPHHRAAEIFFGRDYINNLKRKDPKQYRIIRDACKNGNFALAYGAGPDKLCVTLGRTIEEIKVSLVEYEQLYPEIVNFTRDISRQIFVKGYVLTPFGRKLFVTKDKRYTASNYLIQGTAAGILKRAQVRVDHYLKEELEDQVHLVLPIHDELIFSFPDYLVNRAKEIVNRISKLMITMEEINVPLEVEWKQSNGRWDEAIKYHV